MSPSTATKRRGAPVGNYPQPDSVAAAADELGMKPESVHQLIYGRDNVFHRVAVIVKSMVESGQSFRAERLLVQIDRARHATKAPDLNNELCDENVKVEQAEDRSEARFYRDPNIETARAWRDDLRLESAHNELVIDSIEATYPEIK